MEVKGLPQTIDQGELIRAFKSIGVDLVYWIGDRVTLNLYGNRMIVERETHVFPDDWETERIVIPIVSPGPPDVRTP